WRWWKKRWQGLARLRERLGDAAIAYESWGGSELLFAADRRILERMDYLNQLLFPIFGQTVFSRRPELIQTFGFNPDWVVDLVYNPLEGQLDPGRMMKALAAYIQTRGVTILTGAEVEGLEEKSNGVMVQTRHGVLSSPVNFLGEKVAVCTNAFSRQFFPEMELLPGRGQVLATQPIPHLLLKGTFHFDEGFYYFRNFQQRVVFGGGRNQAFEEECNLEFRTTERILLDLQHKLTNLILPNQAFVIDHSWAGIMAFTPNKQVILRKASDRLVVGVGLNGMGIALGSTLGDEIVQLLD
ncbi:MAG: FAD-binding oxidoreductase, partial [Bacteroidia bacterium]|nr:FAD-binding oxidoreductase [Bacteroidia bacterium]